MSGRKRRMLASFAGAGLALGAWWAVRGPAIERQPLARAPDIDIDPPAMRARREAAIALATMPDDPWTFAETLAPSAPANAADKEDCGIQDGPKQREAAGPDDMPVPLAGPSQRHLAVQARIDAALRASGDPLERAVADLINVGGMRTEAGRDEAVVQQAATSTDPRLYALGYGLCHSQRAPAPSCRALTLERWTQLDPGNGLPWVDVLEQAHARGDAAGVQAAMAQLAAATRFDAYPLAPVGAVARHLPEDERDLAAVHELTIRALEQAMTLPLPAFQSLIQVCRNQAGGDARLATSCRTISDTMFEHSDTFISEAIAGALLQQATGDGSRRDFIRAERALAQAQWSPATGFSACRDRRDSMKKLLRSAEVGEVEAMRERTRKFVTP